MSTTDLKENTSKIYNYLNIKRGVNERIMHRSNMFYTFRLCWSWIALGNVLQIVENSNVDETLFNSEERHRGADGPMNPAILETAATQCA